jgi:hypothetical protein
MTDQPSINPSGAASELLTPGGPTGAPGAPSDASGSQPLTIATGPTVTQSQAAEMAQSLLAAGVSPEAVEAALKADGLEPLAPDTRTDEQKEFDAAFAPPASPSDYSVNYRDLIPADTDPATLSEFHNEATAWAAAVGFPVEMGGGVIERAVEVGRTVSAMAPGERELWVLEQKADFERQAGSPEQAAEWVTLAAKTLARAAPSFTAAMHKSGALDDPFIVRCLANQELARQTRG